MLVRRRLIVPSRRELLVASGAGLLLALGCDEKDSPPAAGGFATAPTSMPTTAPIGQVRDGMVFIPAGEFSMGAVDGDSLARPDEKPRHRVAVDAFWMDQTEVTNAEFRRFVEATKYKTTAEKPADWAELK